MIKQLSIAEAHALLESGEQTGEYAPLGKFYLIEDGKYVGIDNSTGDAWTEDFDTLCECIIWLSGEETEKPIFNRHLDLDIRINDGDFEIDVYEPESGECIQMQHPLSFDEHPEFDKAIGNEIYSWLSLWAEEMKEMEEDDD